MNRIIKFAAAATMAGALAVGMSSPSQARHGRNAAAIGGFAAGALVGAAAASAANGYYAPDYYAPGPYAYEPAYTYDYAPAYTYDYAPTYAYVPRRDFNTGCTTTGTMYGHTTDYSACY